MVDPGLNERLGCSLLFIEVLLLQLLTDHGKPKFEDSQNLLGRVAGRPNERV